MNVCTKEIERKPEGFSDWTRLDIHVLYGLAALTLKWGSQSEAEGCSGGIRLCRHVRYGVTALMLVWGSHKDQRRIRRRDVIVVNGVTT